MGAGHLVGSLVITAPAHAGPWFSAALWRPEEGIIDMSPAMSAFWLTTGSFGVPLVLVGAMVLWLNRRGIVPPLFVAWSLGAWSVTAAVILEPAPWLLITAAAGLLVAAAGRPARQAAPRV